MSFDPGERYKVREHQWTGPTRVIRYVHCQACGIIKRLDGKNSKECKGPVGVALRTADRVTGERDG